MLNLTLEVPLTLLERDKELHEQIEKIRKELRK
jgi:hypothetical protein